MIGGHGNASGPAAWAAMMDRPRSLERRASPAGLGLKPERHIAGFSIRKEDGTEIPLIFEAAVGTATDTVILKLDRRGPRRRRPSGTATASTPTAT